MSRFMRIARWWSLTVLTVIVGGLVAFVTIRGAQLGAAASVILQVGAVTLSIYGGVVFTRQGNDQHIRDTARASARRVLANYKMLGQVSQSITELQKRMSDTSGTDGRLNADLVDLALEGLANQIQGQVITADAAIQDWRDLAPKEVDQEVANVRKGLNPSA